jgi:hypothetical protein
MFSDEREYREARRRLGEEQDKLDARRRQLEQMGLRPDQVERALAPLLGFQQRLAERIAAHEASRREALVNLRGLGRLLVELGAADGRDLAALTGLPADRLAALQGQAYEGATLAEIVRLLDALGVTLRSDLDS